ncbi:sensor domain-containing diguanylate cyclase [Clostridium hydrogenum]|uniref:sensor domain-containing diguanylate cyclase n=1 Tax=Clostridium hydrogenum TaxID=2855764 RepID=UPI001F4809C6|nr:sensor domain-containing diguanylate cyclase [Clostridium hydrogenum]
MKFLYKFTLLLGILIFLSSSIQFAVFNKVFISNTNSLLLNINEKASENVSMQLVENFKKIENYLKAVAADEEIRGNKELLNKINDIIPEVDVVTVLNSRGDIMQLVGNEYSPDVLNLSDRDYFKKAIQGKTYISNVFITHRGSKVVAISVPIVKNNKIDGVVVGIVKLQRTSLASMFDNKEFGENGYISVLDSKGYVVYHPNKARIGKKAVIFNNLREKSGTVITKDYTDTDQFVGYCKVPNLNWYVAVITPTAGVVRNKNIVNYETMFMAIILSCLIILLSAYAIKRYTKPLDKLIYSFNALKNGNYRKINSCNYKKEFHEMIRVYNNAIETLEETHNDLEEVAGSDPLTGAYNRRAFNNFITIVKQEINNNTLQSLGIVSLDVDHFKKLNDTGGHLAGDNILKKLTEIMKEIVGEKFVFRFGGDEFVAILRDVSSEKLLSVAEEIRLKSEASLEGCTVSIGVAEFPKDAYSMDELLELADKALYVSKKSRNKVTSIKKLVKSNLRF